MDIDKDGYRWIQMDKDGYRWINRQMDKQKNR